MNLDENVLTWNEIGSTAETIQSLSNIEIEMVKKAALNAAEYLSNEVFAKDIVHPIAFRLSNNALWTRRWLIWFVKLLDFFAKSEGFNSLCHSFKQPDQFHDALFALEIAEKLAWSGGSISFEDQPDKGKKRQSDLRLIINGQLLHIELATCQSSDQETKASNTFNHIVHSLVIRIGIGFHFAGRLLRWFARPRLEEITEILYNAIEDARIDGFASVEIPFEIEFGISNEEHLHELEEWTSERDLKIGLFDGPSWGGNELARIRTKLRSKAHSGQIPVGEPGLIVIRSSRVLGPETNVQEIVTNLEEELYDYPNLIGVVLIGGYMGTGDESSMTISRSILTTNDRPDLQHEYSLYIPNTYSQTSLTQKNCHQITKCFKQISSEREFAYDPMIR